MAVMLIVEDNTAISTQIEKAINRIANGSKILKSREDKKALEIALYNKDLNTITKEEFTNISLNAIFDILKSKKDLFICNKRYIINSKIIEKLNYVNNTISLKCLSIEISIGKTYKRLVDVLLQ